jgi:PAS domain S-box-containing protein
VKGLAEREAQLRLILSSTGEGIFGIDKYGRCMFANQACAKMLGYADESFLLGKQMHGLIHHTRADGSPYPVEACPTYRSARRTRVQGELLWRADGSAFQADYQSHPMVQDGEVVGAVVTLFDLTERLEAREALRRERDFAESVIATAPVIILVLDSEGRIVRFNPFMAELTGYRLEEVKGKDWFNTFLPERDHAHIHAVFQDSISDLQTGGNVNHILTRAGQERLVEWHNKTLKDAEGQIIGCLAIGHDITAEKEREAQLLQAQKMEVVGQLTGGVAHDFNNLLTIILGNLDFLSTELGKKAVPEIQETLQDAFSAARDAAELTQRLLALSRRQTLKPKYIGLDKVVQTLQKFLRRILGEPFELHVSTPNDGLTVFADPTQLENALLNLVINARDAMPRGGTLNIDIFRKTLTASEVASSDLLSGSYAVMRITDSGIGMPPDVLSHAIEPFFTTKTSGKGTGLGLSMVYSFAKQSGGELRLKSEPGLGTTASLLLPEADSVKASDVTKMHLESLPGGSETILVVEDEPRVRKLLTRRLRNLGYRVIESENAQSAKQLIESHTEVDLLFSDIVMPGEMNGYDLVHWAREKRPELKLLLTTGADSDHVVSQRRNKDEQVSVLRKPYTDKMLQETIRSLLNTIY